MLFLPKIFADSNSDLPPANVLDPRSADPLSEKRPTTLTQTTLPPAHVADDSSSSDGETQDGVKNIEAVAKVWSKTHIILAYIFIWIIYFMDSMHSGMGFTLTPVVTSAFQRHGLTATTGVMSSLIGGLSKLPLAKVLDVWGRPQGFALSVIVLVIGLIMMASCVNVEMYAAAQVFYWVGFNGIGYSLTVFIADISALKNRAFVFAFISSPYIITTWTSGPAAESFRSIWRWAFGTFAIVVPVICSPIFVLFIWNSRKAKKLGVMPQRPASGRNVLQSIKHYAVEFDIIGLLLIAGGLALFLLPFNIYTYQANGWRSPMIICMLVFGILLLIAFGLYERFLAPVKFFPFRLLIDRSVAGSCFLAALLFVNFYIWNNFFSSFLLVVNGLSFTEATYVGRIYSVGSCFWSLIVGLLVRWTGRFKWLGFYFGVPVNILGVALMIAFRQPDVNIGYIVMCQIFIAVAGGTLVICEQMAVMAAIKHQYLAVGLAIQQMSANIGGAIGSTIAAAIWNGVFPDRLTRYLPPESQADMQLIMGNITKQMEYPLGTPTRSAINHAYGDAQRIMLATATGLSVLAFVAVGVWRDIPVKRVDKKEDEVAVN